MITAVSLLAICVFSYFLIITDYYDDGALGRIALAIMSFSAGLGFSQHFAGNTFDPVSQAIFVGTALFQARHIYRIMRAQAKIRLRREGLI